MRELQNRLVNEVKVSNMYYVCALAGEVLLRAGWKMRRRVVSVPEDLSLTENVPKPEIRMPWGAAAALSMDDNTAFSAAEAEERVAPGPM